MHRITVFSVLIILSLFLTSCSDDNATAPVDITLGSNIDGSFDTLGNGRGANLNPGVIPPNAKPKGQSYADWSVAFWQWLWSVPADINPSLYDDGDLISSGQSGSVWFLSPNYGGYNERTATIPTGKMLFIDVAAWFFAPAIGDPEDEEGLRTMAAEALAATSNVMLEVDGVMIEGLENYIFQSPELFGFTLPEGNILEMFGYATPAGDYYPAVSDGYYVMLAPLSVGEHTIHIHAEFPDPFGVSDVIYYLTVEECSDPEDPEFGHKYQNRNGHASFE